MKISVPEDSQHEIPVLCSGTGKEKKEQPRQRQSFSLGSLSALAYSVAMDDVISFCNEAVELASLARVRRRCERAQALRVAKH